MRPGKLNDVMMSVISHTYLLFDEVDAVTIRIICDCITRDGVRYDGVDVKRSHRLKGLLRCYNHILNNEVVSITGKVYII